MLKRPTRIDAYPEAFTLYSEARVVNDEVSREYYFDQKRMAVENFLVTLVTNKIK